MILLDSGYTLIEGDFVLNDWPLLPLGSRLQLYFFSCLWISGLYKEFYIADILQSEEKSKY